MIATDVYGLAGPLIRAILEKVEKIRWFTAGDDDPSPFVQDHAQALGFMQPVAVKRIEGPLRLRTEHAADAAWRARCDDVIRSGQTEAVQRKRIRELIIPPLWVFPGNLAVCGVTFVARRDVLLRSGLAICPEDPNWDVAWRLMCDAEDSIWNALTWELVRVELNITNPFTPLIDLYNLGWFPIGMEGDAYSIYRYKPTRE